MSLQLWLSLDSVWWPHYIHLNISFILMCTWIICRQWVKSSDAAEPLQGGWKIDLSWLPSIMDICRAVTEGRHRGWALGQGQQPQPFGFSFGISLLWEIKMVLSGSDPPWAQSCCSKVWAQSGASLNNSKPKLSTSYSSFRFCKCWWEQGLFVDACLQGFICLKRLISQLLKYKGKGRKYSKLFRWGAMVWVLMSVCSQLTNAEPQPGVNPDEFH